MHIFMQRRPRTWVSPWRLGGGGEDALLGRVDAPGGLDVTDCGGPLADGDTGCIDHKWRGLTPPLVLFMWQAVGISSGDMTPVTKTDNLGRVDQSRFQEWATLGLRAIAAGEVSHVVPMGRGQLVQPRTSSVACTCPSTSFSFACTTCFWDSYCEPLIRE